LSDDVISNNSDRAIA